ncbi:hypothetical protein ACLKA6_011078 [Drosophila palustris]
MNEETESQTKEEEAVGDCETVSKEKSKDNSPSETESEIVEKSAEAANETEKSLSSRTAGDKDTVQGQVKGDASQQDFAAYEEHVSYAADGGAIYTDPSTKQKYKWCNTQNNWQPLSEDEAATAGNLYENEHYKWCHETQQWLPKQTNPTTTETEHYKWDEKQQKWLPKQTQTQAQAAPGQDAVYGVDENGDRTYTDKDGAVFFWDASKSAWFPKIDDDFMARYQMNYGFIDNTSAGEREKAAREAAEAKRKEEELKRMTAEAQAAMNAPLEGHKDGVPATAAAGKRKAQEPPKWFEMDPTQNTKVYVSNLPLDINMEEFAELMGKCGLVMRDPQTQKYKLKLYTEKDGQIKGDGLCDYIKVSLVFNFHKQRLD